MEEQFDRIAEGDWRSLYHAALRSGLDGQSAEDVVREALHRAYRLLSAMPHDHLERFRVHAWLDAITKELAHGKR